VSDPNKKDKRMQTGDQQKTIAREASMKNGGSLETNKGRERGGWVLKSVPCQRKGKNGGGGPVPIVGRPGIPAEEIKSMKPAEKKEERHLDYRRSRKEVSDDC